MPSSRSNSGGARAAGWRAVRRGRRPPPAAALVAPGLLGGVREAWAAPSSRSGSGGARATVQCVRTLLLVLTQGTCALLAVSTAVSVCTGADILLATFLLWPWWMCVLGGWVGRLV